MAIEPVCLLTSDWHAAKGAWAKYPTLTGDSYYSVRQIVDKANELVVDVLAAGDLFDKTNPDSNTVNRIVNEVNRLRRRVFFTQGQHEKTSGAPWLNLASTAYHLHQSTVRVGKFKVYGIDYTRPEQLPAEIAKIPSGTDLLMMHQVWRDFMGDLGHSDGSLDMLPPVPMVLTGDYHQGMIKRIVVKNKPMTVFSPGSMCMQAIDEDDAKSFFILYDDGSTSPVYLHTREVYRYAIYDENELEQFLDHDVYKCTQPASHSQLPDELRKNIVDVRYDPDIPNVYSRIVKAIDNKAHLFAKRLAPQRRYGHVDEPSTVTSKATRRGLDDCLELYCSRDSGLYKNIARLLNTEDVRAELEVIASDFEA